MKRRLYQLDVFTNTPFAGNSLAVVIDGDGLTSRRMLDIAREMNLSETVFVQQPTNAKALARLRIFTTQNELRLAGHPVIGTWFLLAQLGVSLLKQRNLCRACDILFGPAIISVAAKFLIAVFDCDCHSS